MLIPDMTLLLAMQGRDGLLIAADGRAVTAQAGYTDGIHKILPVFSNCCVAYCGDDAGFGRPIVDAAMRECGASPVLTGDASAFSDTLSGLARDRLAAGKAGENKRNLTYIVAGYSLHGRRSDRAVLNVIGPDNLWQPYGEVKGWFCPACRHELIPYYNSVLGERSAGLAINDLARIAVLVLYETAKIDLLVAGPLDLFIVRPDGFKQMPTKRLLKQAEVTQRELEKVLRNRLALPQPRHSGSCLATRQHQAHHSLALVPVRPTERELIEVFL
jgi:20S proteasome alpha/beta subunit